MISHAPYPRVFMLQRYHDSSGISGTGVVAVGVEFANSQCVMQWQTDVSSVAIYDHIRDIERIHGHDGDTQIVYRDNA